MYNYVTSADLGDVYIQFISQLLFSIYYGSHKNGMFLVSHQILFGISTSVEVLTLYTDQFLVQHKLLPPCIFRNRLLQSIVNANTELSRHV